MGIQKKSCQNTRLSWKNPVFQRSVQLWSNSGLDSNKLGESSEISPSTQTSWNKLLLKSCSRVWALAGPITLGQNNTVPRAWVGWLEQTGSFRLHWVIHTRFLLCCHLPHSLDSPSVSFRPTRTAWQQQPCIPRSVCSNSVCANP